MGLTIMVYIQLKISEAQPNLFPANLLHIMKAFVAGIDSCVVVSVGGSRSSAPSLCGEHGHCINQPGIGYKCQCQPGYTGKYCHENINDCKVNPCENGGTCVDKVNAFQCICNEGWEGALCSINTDDCTPSPCRNNGTCIDGVADFECECKKY
ncbi:protein jagged-1b-like [Sitophilus oryzae]|uniref:Protein jagged-1b-like n=1 Tax=Sitophilus oryzae TaxID=7048 RepID=A0A6J2Y1E4_SITOR|nr:protein jagged-1b-like [Sitophilus oryzae]